MNGSRPKPPRPSSATPKPSRASRRRPRPSKTPWVPLLILFGAYFIMGLLMSVPSPPYWVWIAVGIAIPLLSLGVNRPEMVIGKTDRGGLMAYLGGLMMAIALAVSINYIGSENSFEDVRFFTAIAALGGLCLVAVVLTAIAAIAGASVGTRLMIHVTYGRSVTTVILMSFLGLFAGGVAGLFVLTLGMVTV